MITPDRMPRTSAAVRHRRSAPTMTITVAQNALPVRHLANQQGSIYIVAATIAGHRSPVVAGTRSATIAALSRWASAMCPAAHAVNVRVHPVSIGATTRLTDRIVRYFFNRTPLTILTLEHVPYLDLATQHQVVEVSAGRRYPDLLTLRQWSHCRSPYPAGTYWPDAKKPEKRPAGKPLARRSVAPAESLRLVGDPARWCSPERPLVLHTAPPISQMACEPSSVPDADVQPGDVLEVYTDASLGADRRQAGFGLVCPQRREIGSGMLSAPWSLVFDSSLSELLAVSVAVTQFSAGCRRMVVYTDSRTAVRWWETPETIPDRQGQVRQRILTQRAELEQSGPGPCSVEVRWVKGHVGGWGNEWADRSARLTRRCVNWCEQESERRRKFQCLADEFTADLGGRTAVADGEMAREGTLCSDDLAGRSRLVA